MRHGAAVPPPPMRVDYHYGDFHRDPVFHPERVVYNQRDYYYDRGVYYVMWGDSYRISRPPVGAFVPLSIYVNVKLYHYTMRVNGVRVEYYYDDGVFFRLDRLHDRFEVVRPPVGYRFYDLPSSYEVYVINGRRHYVIDDVVFEKYGSYYRVVGYREF